MTRVRLLSHAGQALRSQNFLEDNLMYSQWIDEFVLLWAQQVGGATKCAQEREGRSTFPIATSGTNQRGSLGVDVLPPKQLTRTSCRKVMYVAMGGSVVIPVLH